MGCLGQAHNDTYCLQYSSLFSGDFKPEDLARTWVYVYASQLGEFLPFMAKSGGIKQIYFSGNFFNHKLIRDDITEAIICHNLAQVRDKQVDS